MDVRTHFTALGLLMSVLFCNAYAGGNSFSVMTYNLENLYDHLHDEDKSDYQWLPLEVKNASDEIQQYCASISSRFYRQRCFEMDWSQEVAHAKAANIARVIKAARESGTPDVVVFQEVENIRILRDMVNLYLPNEGYRYISLIEGPDRRGIDVAIISKLEMVGKAKDYPIDLSPAYPGQDPGRVKQTRGILSVTFRHRGGLVTVLANHWPSQRNPDQTRVIAAQVMLKAIEEAPGAVVATGDFNTMANDEINAINSILLNRKSEHYCLDAEKVFFGEQLPEDKSGFKGPSFPLTHRGTHFYRGEWSSLDRLFIPRKHVLNKGLRPLWSTYKVVYHPFMFEDEDDIALGKLGQLAQRPMRFNEMTKEGFSDHLPVVMDFTWR